MLHTNYGHFKYLGGLFGLNVSLLMLSNIVSGRLVDIGGMVISVAEFPFPLCYLIGSVITEVYGYRQARSIAWLSSFCQMAAMFGLYLCLLPASPDFFVSQDKAYQSVFSTGLRISLAGFSSMVSGDLFNSYILAKMKIWNKGKYFWFRFASGTLIGEGVNTLVFFVGAFYGIWTNDVLSEAILWGWLIKTAVELILLPMTYPLVSFLKKSEKVDHYDYKTNFNPFIIDMDEA